MNRLACPAYYSTGGASLNAHIEALQHQGQPRPVPHLHILELNLRSTRHLVHKIKGKAERCQNM